MIHHEGKPLIADSTIREYCHLLSKSKVKIWSSVGLTSYTLFKRNKLSASRLVEILELLLNICVRFKILDNRFNVLEKELPDLSKCLYQQKIFTTEDNSKKIFSNESNLDNVVLFVLNRLKQIIQENSKDEEIKNKFNKYDYAFEDNDLAYIVLRYIANKRLLHGLTFDTNKNQTLEHFLPQNHKKYWTAHENADEISSQIGNMILLEDFDNSKLGNKGFAKKIEAYKKENIIDCVGDSNLEIMKVNKETDWNLDFVKKRSKDILDYFFEEFLYKI